MSAFRPSARCAVCDAPLSGAMTCHNPDCTLNRRGYSDGTRIISTADGEPMDARFIPTGDDHSILDEAASLVNGDRQAAYGHPSDNHACTAALWTAYLSRRAEASSPDAPVIGIDAFDVCMLNILQKVSRLAHSRTRDGLVDIAGFAANADMVEP